MAAKLTRIQSTDQSLNRVQDQLSQALNPLLAKLLVSLVEVPSSVGSAGEVGQFALSESYLYICVSTDTWRRVALAAW